MVNVFRVACGCAVLWALGCSSSSTGTSNDCAGTSCESPRRCIENMCRTTCRGTPECHANQHCEDGICLDGASAATSGSSSSGGASGNTTSSSSSGDAGQQAKSLGDVCAADAECAFNMCRTVYGGSDIKVCVRTCTQQSDCGSTGLFCNPTSVGANQGLCVPRSSAHCLACASDAECGYYAEACIQPAGEGARVCQVDCSLGGAEACPPDYACVDVNLGSSTRKLCRPSTGECATAEGGYCARLYTTPACVHGSDAGSCTGTRSCGTGGRFTACSAPSPSCKNTCTAVNPAGCSLSVCPGVASTPQNCGTCGHACPGATQSNAVVACQAGGNCSLACAGENYDVNGMPGDGCEVEDLPAHNHAQVDATYVADLGCNDSDSARTLAGKMPMDNRNHQPAIAGLDVVSGTAPDWFRIRATGGLTCINDVNMALSVSGSTVPDCFALTVSTNNGDYACGTDMMGNCAVTNGSGSYSGDTDIFVLVEKLCASTLPETDAYTVTGHL